MYKNINTKYLLIGILFMLIVFSLLDKSEKFKSTKKKK